MRPVVVAAILLLVVLMSMSASADWNPGEMCRTKYPATPCKNMGGKDWYQFGPHRSVKAFSKYKEQSHTYAKHVCQWNRNGDLVSIHSLVELEQVECAMYRVSTRKALHWIGLFRNGNGFIWTDGSKHDYSNWAQDEPNNYLGRERCVEMNF